MKKLVVLSFITILFAACGNNAEEKAALKIQLAQEALQAGNYSEAKIQLDSIKILYPKAVDARRKAIRVFKEVEKEEQEQTIAYLDSMLIVKQHAFDSIKGRFVLEKDPEYQQIGNYFYPTQVVEKNLHRSFLRFQVSERGEMVMTSIYCGPSNIHHIAIKVIALDGSFAETPASKDSYETTDMNEKIEKADYKLGEDGNVIGFIYFNREKNLKVEYLGGRKYSTTMSADDRKALTAVYELTQILSSIEQIKSEQKEAHVKLEFVNRKLQETTPPTEEE